MDAGAVATLIPVVAIAGGITYAILSTYWKSKEKVAGSSPDLRAALDANTAASRAILERLDSIEARLGTVEKTLTDIP
ncbi:hypothetical protein [Glaciihabitans sp. UYNi722]|uniref:hypothetical protein n=1 Tax=Glaciihabitans sp. UYNi722 TaxID=3156344 RepID=UPI0033928B8C